VWPLLFSGEIRRFFPCLLHSSSSTISRLLCHGSFFHPCSYFIFCPFLCILLMHTSRASPSHPPLELNSFLRLSRIALARPILTTLHPPAASSTTSTASRRRTTPRPTRTSSARACARSACRSTASISRGTRVSRHTFRSVFSSVSRCAFADRGAGVGSHGAAISNDMGQDWILYDVGGSRTTVRVLACDFCV
jgi:hypothetical protein